MSGSPVSLVIAGAGPAGLSLAIAARLLLGETSAVVVCDRHVHAVRGGARTSAIAAGPRRMLEALGVWPMIGDRAQPMQRLTITDSRLADVIRPAYLGLAERDAPNSLAEGEPFAHMVFHRDLEPALEKRALEVGVRLHPSAVATLDVTPGAARVTTTDGQAFAAPLVVAADGKRSTVRDLAGIQTIGWPYRRSAIAVTIEVERDHAGEAVQHFLPAGTFALLPLTDRRYSVVWVEMAADAERLCALTPDDFAMELAQRIGHRFGALRVLDAPQVFPLELRVARSFIGERVALIGDAAHAMHPLAGQGLNFALRDVGSLVDEIVRAASLGLDIGAEDALMRYERSRRFDTMTMLAMTDALHRLFANDMPPVRLLRDFGLGVVDRAHGLKRAMMEEAAGLTGAPPSLFLRRDLRDSEAIDAAVKDRAVGPRPAA